MLSFTIGKSSIAIFLDEKFYSIDNTHINYNLVLLELRLPQEKRDHAKLAELCNYRQVLEVLTEGFVTVTEEAVLYLGEEVNNYMAQRMLELLEDGHDLTPWARFMNNVYGNPAAYARDELYEWMEKAEMPITEDGHFLAFKKVRSDYTDCHTGRFDNSPGNILEMDRVACDPVRTNHCSSGFHFCSAGYLPNFGGQRIVVVKINPKDVTSIPNDYDFTKGRCCRYEVVAELTKDSAAYAKCWKKGLVNIEDPTELPGEVLKNIVLPPPALDEAAEDISLNPGASPFPTPEQLALVQNRVTDATEHEVNVALSGLFEPHETRLRDQVKTALWMETNVGPEDSRPAIEKLDEANKAQHSPTMDEHVERSMFLSKRAREIRDEFITRGLKQAMGHTPRPKNNPPGRFPPPFEPGEAYYDATGLHVKKDAAARIEEETTDAGKATKVANTVTVFVTTADKVFGEMEIRQAVGRQGGSVRAAARDLGINESTLRGWLKKLES